MVEDQTAISNETDLFDIIVVGGGPVGSQVAFRSALAGYSVAVVEKRNEFNSGVCCTGIVGFGCIDFFEIDRNLILNRYSSAKFFSPSGTMLRLERPEPIAALLNRSAFDDFMAKRAQKAGASYLLGADATSLAFKPEKVIVHYSQLEEPKTIEGRAVVCSGGATSALFKKNSEFTAADLVIGAQVSVEAPDISEVEVYTGRRVAPGFFAWLVPLGDGRALAGLLSRQKITKYFQEFLAKLEQDGKITHDLVDINYRPIAFKQPPKTSGDRFLIVGSAAGQVKPATGGGIYFGLLAADCAAAVLDQALRADDLNAGYLSRYETIWQAKLQPEIESERRARVLYERLTDSEINMLFQLAKTVCIEEYISTLDEISFDWHAGLISNLAKKYYNI